LSKKDYIGIFGGSFDPIHKGHIESLKSVTEQLNLSKVLVIPNKVSPLKDLSVASSLEKIKMLEIAFKDFKEIEIEDYELKKEGPSFMIETLQYLDKKLGEKKHFLLLKILQTCLCIFRLKDHLIQYNTLREDQLLQKFSGKLLNYNS